MATKHKENAQRLLEDDDNSVESSEEEEELNDEGIMQSLLKTYSGSLGEIQRSIHIIK